MRPGRSSFLTLLALMLCALSVGAVQASRAVADVCSGGAPYQPSGTSPAGLGEAVPLLSAPRWSLEQLPQWAETQASGEWGERLAYAWYRSATLWAASPSDAWWVIPGLGCGLTEGSSEFVLQEGNAYPTDVCIAIYAQLAFAGYDCADRRQLAEPALPVSVLRGSSRLLAGFAPPSSGSVTVRLQYGEVTLPAAGGVYGGAVSSTLGTVAGVTDLSAAVARTPAPVVLLDQTGLFSSSAGSLAGLPRLHAVAARIHAHIASLSAEILGGAVSGHRPHDQVLYGSGRRVLAGRVARALGAAAPRALSGGALSMFGGLAEVVVLVGRAN